MDSVRGFRCDSGYELVDIYIFFPSGSDSVNFARDSIRCKLKSKIDSSLISFVTR